MKTESEIPVIKSKGDTTKCYYCNRRYNYTEALHENGCAKCPHCGNYMKDLNRRQFKHPSYE